MEISRQCVSLELAMQGKAKLRGLLYDNFKVKEFNDPNELKLVDLEPDPDELEGDGRFKVNVKTK